MHLSEHESPKGKKVSLFITCMGDMLYPETGMSVVEILEHLDMEVDFPAEQTCCGQPAYNAGYWKEAKKVAETFLDAFEESSVIVTPSGSCAAMVREIYPKLFKDDPKNLPRVERIKRITWEFTEFIVEGLGIENLNLRLPKHTVFAFHDSCHSLRHTESKSASRTLMANIENAEVVELESAETCCGFGGVFSVKMADLSGAMLKDKLDSILACPAKVLCGDISCMAHINGGLALRNSDVRMQHLADFLAGSLKNNENSI
ncbi:MAG: (Fe-S)-binding protein [Anaerolineaceae bacterium]|nr:(Fe-S)-binding protein [Anaerolineaceae bacterium]